MQYPSQVSFLPLVLCMSKNLFLHINNISTGFSGYVLCMSSFWYMLMDSLKSLEICFPLGFTIIAFNHLWHDDKLYVIEIMHPIFCSLQRYTIKLSWRAVDNNQLKFHLKLSKLATDINLCEQSKTLHYVYHKSSYIKSIWLELDAHCSWLNRKCFII